jgi:hypothetical protein
VTASVHYFAALDQRQPIVREAFQAASVGHRVVVLPQVKEEPSDIHFDSASKVIVVRMVGL